MIRVIKNCKICGTQFSSEYSEVFTCSTKCLSTFFKRKEREKKNVKQTPRPARIKIHNPIVIQIQKRSKLKATQKRKILRRARRAARAQRMAVKRNIVPLSFYESREWRELRYRVIKKFGRQCQACLAVDKRIHVDHIKPRSKYPELELVESNLQILCEDCNMGKSNKDETDWRPK